MNSHAFIWGISTAVLALFLAVSPIPAGNPAENREKNPAIPILMFHKVDDNPRDPESVSPEQLATLFTELWRLGFHPVNISDILDNNVDRIVPKGLKPLALTADDAHRSVLFSRASGIAGEFPNSRSLVDILRDSLKPFGREPRATFFVGGVEDDRISKTPGGYFGGFMPLPEALKTMADLPGLEIGYHTLSHIRMLDMGATRVRELVLEQIAELKALGLSDRVVPILAYPYGVHPEPDGIDELRRLGFKGAVLAFPGVNEARYASLPVCEYDGKLLTDPYKLPRVGIGSRLYAPNDSPQKGTFLPIDPLEDFRKDVLGAIPLLYESSGP